MLFYCEIARYTVCVVPFTSDIATEYTDHAASEGRPAEVYVPIALGTVVKILQKDNCVSLLIRNHGRPDVFNPYTILSLNVITGRNGLDDSAQGTRLRSKL